MLPTRRIVRPLAALAAAGLAIVIVASSFNARATPTTTDVQPSLPLRPAFYYPWFPEAWKQHDIFPYTNYQPTLGTYDASDTAILRQHIVAMQYGGIQAGISSWWGQNSRTDQRLPILLGAAAGTPFRWSIY